MDALLLPVLVSNSLPYNANHQTPTFRRKVVMVPFNTEDTVGRGIKKERKEGS